MKSDTHPSPIVDFWASPPEALFGRVVVAAVLGKSVSWLERKALSGDGPPFRKLDRHALYQKSDVLDYLHRVIGPRVNSTSGLKLKEARP